ncbi:hypothetical protein ACQRBK_07545 [Peptoniphilaceae bacterium SGI.137]
MGKTTTEMQLVAVSKLKASFPYHDEQAGIWKRPGLETAPYFHYNK